MNDSLTSTEKLYGWYDRADQPVDQPTYNPAFPGMCLFCGNQTSDEDVRTIALLRDGSARSFFYRVHRTCHEAASEDQRNQITSVIFDSIDHHGDERV